MRSLSLEHPDGRTVRVHDSEHDGPNGTILWHHGTPQTGALLDPVLDAATARGLRLLSYGRPSYGGSAPLPGRDVASAASDVALIVDGLEIDSIATLGASGGGPHAIACAALLPERVWAVAVFASPAPFDDATWFDGMAGDGAGLRAAQAGRTAREAHAETAVWDPTTFTADDESALEHEWRSLGEDVGRAAEFGGDGEIADDLAFIAPWGCDLAAVKAPVLVVQGGSDRVIPAAHADRLVRQLPNAELWMRPRDSHVSIMRTLPLAMDWLLAQR